jgi:hypothetical protein
VRHSTAVLLLAGLLIAGLGTLQFLLVLALSPDPHANPAVNGALMWFSWAAGGAVAALGLLAAAFGPRGGRGSLA